MNIEDQLQRQININMQLRRQLETARRDAVEYCAKFCEDHAMHYSAKVDKLVPVEQAGGRITHTGYYYAEGLREIIGNARKD
jgi:hypothetical protein